MSEEIKYYAAEHGKTLGKLTSFTDEDGRVKEKDAFFYAETRQSWFSVYPADVYFYGREITEDQAREWVIEMGGDPDIVLSDEAVHEYPEEDIAAPEPYY